MVPGTVICGYLLCAYAVPGPHPWGAHIQWGDDSKKASALVSRVDIARRKKKQNNKPGGMGRDTPFKEIKSEQILDDEKDDLKSR